MDNKKNLKKVKMAYMNRAGYLMECYFSDLLTDIKHIEEMKKGDILYFIIQPNCTHCTTKEQYDDIRDSCATVWGNYAVIRIEMIDIDQYIIKNWAILDQSSYDTKSQELIQHYKDFVMD